MCVNSRRQTGARHIFSTVPVSQHVEVSWKKSERPLILFIIHSLYLNQSVITVYHQCLNNKVSQYLLKVLKLLICKHFHSFLLKLPVCCLHPKMPQLEAYSSQRREVREFCFTQKHTGTVRVMQLPLLVKRLRQEAVRATESAFNSSSSATCSALRSLLDEPEQLHTPACQQGSN